MAWSARPLSVDENEPLGDDEEIPEAELLAFLDEPLRHRHAAWDPHKHPRDRKGEFAHTAVGSGQLDLFGKTDLVGAQLGLDANGKVVVKKMAPAAGDADSALKTVDSEVAAIKAEVQSHKIEDTHDLSFGAMGQVERVRLDDGEELIHKKQSPDNAYGDTADEFKENFGVTPKEANDAEELAPYVSEVFGAGAPAVWRSGPYDQWQQVAPGMMASEFLDSDEARRAMNGQMGQRIALFDAVTNNGDRHGGNWLITEDDVPVPIDHGKAFMTGPYSGGSPFVDAHFGEKISKADAALMLAKLDALEPKFKAKHREAWFRQARERLVDIAANGIHDFGGYNDVGNS